MDQTRGGELIVTAAAFVIVVAGLKEAGPLILPFLVALLLTVLSAPAVLWLERHRVPAGLAATAAMVGLIALVGAFGALLTTSVRGFEDAVPGYRAALARTLNQTLSWLDRLPLDVSRSSAVEAFDPGSLVGMMGTMVTGVLAALSNTALVILTAVFMLLEVAGFPRKLRAILRNPNADLGTWGEIMDQVQRYLAIKTGVSAVTGALIALWLGLLGVDFPLLWGLVAFMLNYIPSIGSIIAAIPAVSITVVQPELGFGYALLVGLGYLVVNVLLGNVIEPQLMGRRFGLSPLVVFLSLLFWGWVWGPIGMLLAVPLTMITRIVLEQREDTRWIAVLLAAAPRPSDRTYGSPADADRDSA